MDPHLREQFSKAILETLIYADIFDYPLTVEEVHRYLIEVKASRQMVKALLHDGMLLEGRVARCNGHFALSGRERLFSLRERRNEIARARWQRAKRYAWLLAHLPFVRMVAVTGALTMNNVEEEDDIDFLIVTVPGRLWLCRGLVVLLVRIADMWGHRLCPNYFLSERALMMEQRDLFTAHELAQMVPLYGLAVYRRIRRLNSWSTAYLPNAGDNLPQPDSAGSLSWLGRGIKRMLEWALGGAIGEAIEKWEMQRKVRKLSLQAGIESDPLAFSPDRCKGHFEGHGRRTMKEFARRTQEYGL